MFKKAIGLVTADSKPGMALRILVGASVSLVLGWIVIRGLDWHEVGKTFSYMSPGFALMGLASFSMHLTLRAYRWRILFVNQKITLFKIFLVQNTGIGVNNLMPFRILGEVIQVTLLVRRFGLNAAGVVATVFAEHLMDVIASASLMMLGVIFIGELRGYSLQMATAIILSTVSIMAFLFFALGLGAIPVIRRVNFLRNFADALLSFKKARIRLMLSYIMSTGHWGFLGLCGWFFGQTLDISIGPDVMVVVFLAAAFFISAVPSLPAGVGTFEFAVIYTLSLFGVDKSVALTFALVMHVVTFVPATVVAMFVISGVPWRFVDKEKAISASTSPV
jgi:uncharacterized membrane protein YbhN (UPF0104 family)